MGAGNTENAFVFVRENLDEPGLGIGPVFENPGGARAAGEVAMALEEGAHAIEVSRLDEGL
jgi:hypothetical protein